MSGAGKVSAGVFVAAACALALVFNILGLLVYNRRKRLHKRGHLLPLFHLAGVDILAVLTWSAVTVAIAVVDWIPPDAVCQAQAFFRSLWCLLHVHTLTALAIERAIRLVKPSRHVTIFIPRVVLFLLIGLWLFDVLLASIPHYGWLEFKLENSELQCSADYTYSVATLVFKACITYFIPVLLILICYALCFWKVVTARKKTTPKGEILLEENPYSPGDTYAEKMSDYQNKVKDAGMKKCKPKLGNRKFTPQGYVTDSDSNVNARTNFCKSRRKRVEETVHSVQTRIQPYEDLPYHYVCVRHSLAPVRGCDIACKQ